MPETGDLGSIFNYLEIIFRLLNEDLLRSLREGSHKMLRLK